MDAKQALLRQVPLLAGVGSHGLDRISQLCDEVDVPAGHVLAREGAFGEEFFVIVDGRIRIHRGDTTLATLGPGEFLGEIALIDRGRRTASATCETACRLLVLGHREFNSLIDNEPQIRLRVLEALAGRVRQLDPESEY